MLSRDSLDKSLIAGLPTAAILSRYERAPGNELQSSKFSSPESSAALVANTFGLFLERPQDFPLPAEWHAGAPVTRLTLEEELRFPWRGGRHPWLDVVLETQTHLVGIESKRYEPFRASQPGAFSRAYWHEVWGKRMGPFEWLRDGLAKRPSLFQHLDAVQLVKHAFAIRTQAHALGKQPLLVYLYAEPRSWPNGKAIPEQDRNRHAEEARCFARLVQGAEVHVACCSYLDLLARFSSSRNQTVRAHAKAVTERFDVG